MAAAKKSSKAFAENEIPSEFKDGLRVTRTPQAMQVVDGVLRAINQRIVIALNRLGKKATGHNGGSNASVMHAQRDQCESRIGPRWDCRNAWMPKRCSRSWTKKACPAGFLFRGSE